MNIHGNGMHGNGTPSDGMLDDGMHHDGVRTPHEGNDALAFRLRGLRRDLAPQRDLWPGIAAQLAQRTQSAVATPASSHATHAAAASPRRARRHSRSAPWALAASLVLAVGVAWQQRPQLDAPAPSTQLLPRAAQAMTAEYDAALRELEASAPAATQADPTLRELDRGAAQIRTALSRSPESRFLIERLRSTYEKRLQLTERAALG